MQSSLAFYVFAVNLSESTTSSGIISTGTRFPVDTPCYGPYGDRVEIPPGRVVKNTRKFRVEISGLTLLRVAVLCTILCSVRKTRNMLKEKKQTTCLMVIGAQSRYSSRVQSYL